MKNCDTFRQASIIAEEYRRMTKIYLPRVYADYEYLPRSNCSLRRADNALDQLVPMSQQQGSPEKKMEDTEPKKKRANPVYNDED